MTAHILKTPADCGCDPRRERQTCPVCDWGLGVCRVCGAAERELTEFPDCPIPPFDPSCDCSARQGHCVRGDLDICPRVADVDDGTSEEDPGAECGRWSNGRLTRSCSKAGSEECDFECPYRNSLYGVHDQ